MKLAGMVYLHDISLDRITGTAQKNLTMVKKLCGDNALPRVVLATTKWKRIDDENDGVRRENQVKDIFWNRMIRHGSKMTRFGDCQESAQKIVHEILELKRDTDALNLCIQRELVDLKKYLPQTRAGKQLFHNLKGLLVRLKEDMALLRATHVAHQDSTWKEEHDELEKRIKRVVSEIEQLEVPFVHKILGLLGINRG